MTCLLNVSSRPKFKLGPLSIIHQLKYLVIIQVLIQDLTFLEFGCTLTQRPQWNRQESDFCILGGEMGFYLPYYFLLAFSLQGERATGYGVALLLALFGKSSESELLKSIAPKQLMNNLQIEFRKQTYFVYYNCNYSFLCFYDLIVMINIPQFVEI